MFLEYRTLIACLCNLYVLNNLTQCLCNVYLKKNVISFKVDHSGLLRESRIERPRILIKIFLLSANVGSRMSQIDELVPFNMTIETRRYLDDYNSIANLILWYIDPPVRQAERVEFPQRVVLQIRNGATLKPLTLVSAIIESLVA